MKLLIELNRMDTLEVLRGLTELSKKRTQHMRRAKKRGFKDHEAAEIAMGLASVDELIKKIFADYKAVWPE